MSKYDRGSLVAIQLPRSAVWLTAAVAHREKSRSRSKWIILYVFKIATPSIPSSSEVKQIARTGEIVSVIRTGDDRITAGTWPGVGEVSAEQLQNWPLLPVAMFWGRGGEEESGPYSLRLLHPDLLDEREDLGSLTPQDAAKLPESTGYGAAMVAEVLQMAVDNGWNGRRLIPGCESSVDILGSFTDPRLPARTSIGWSASVPPKPQRNN